MTYETLRAGRTGEKKPEPIDGILRRRTVEPRDPRGAFITRRTRLLAADPPEKRIVVDNAPRKKCSQRWEPVEFVVVKFVVVKFILPVRAGLCATYMNRLGP